MYAIRRIALPVPGVSTAACWRAATTVNDGIAARGMASYARTRPPVTSLAHPASSRRLVNSIGHPAGVRTIWLWPFSGSGKRPTEPPVADVQPPPDVATQVAQPERIAEAASISIPSPSHEAVQSVSDVAASDAVHALPHHLWHSSASAVQELTAAEIQHGFLGRIFSKNAELLFCHAHDWTGLSWWLTIPTVVWTARLLLVRVQIKGMQGTARNVVAKPEIDYKVAQIREAQERGDVGATKRLQEEFMEIRKRTGLSATAPLAFPLAQGFLATSFFFAMKNLAEAGIPSLLKEGPMWFMDLTAPGGLFGLPLLASSMILLSIETAADQGGAQVISQQMRWVFRGLIGASWFFLCDLPTSVFVLFCSTNLFTLLWGLFSRSAPPAWKSLLGMPDMKAAQAKAKELELKFPIATPSSSPASPVRASRSNGANPTLQHPNAYARMGFLEGFKAMRRDMTDTDVVKQGLAPTPSARGPNVIRAERPNASLSMATPEARQEIHGSLWEDTKAGHSEGAEVKVGERGAGPSAGGKVAAPSLASTRRRRE